MTYIQYALFCGVFVCCNTLRSRQPRKGVQGYPYKIHLSARTIMCGVTSNKNKNINPAVL